MKAAILESCKNIKLKEVPIPDFSEDEVLLHVKSCGLCGTDIHAFDGDFMPHFPLILGHEFSGVIAEAGKNIKKFKTGDRVTVCPEIYCHKCFNCRRGEEKYCLNWKSIGTTINGAFAEFIALREECLFNLPDNMTFDEGALIEPAACVYAGIRTIPEYFDKRVIILGAGSIGLVHLICLAARNPLLLDIIDISDEKLILAKKIGANNTFNVNNQKNFYDFIKKKYDVVIDCTGVPEVINKGFDLLEKNGHFIFFGVAPTSEKVLISPYRIYENSWKITGVYPDMRSFGNIIKMIESKILDFKPLVSHRFYLNDFIEAFSFFRDIKNYRLKVIVYND